MAFQWQSVDLTTDPLQPEYHRDPDDVIDAWSELVALIDRPAWHAYAACRGQGNGAWFPTIGGTGEPPRAVCATCPVQSECLSAAMEDPQTLGVWGGTSVVDRKHLRNGRPLPDRRRPVPVAALIAFVEDTQTLSWPDRFERWNHEHPERPFSTADALASAWRYVIASDVA